MITNGLQRGFFYHVGSSLKSRKMRNFNINITVFSVKIRRKLHVILEIWSNYTFFVVKCKITMPLYKEMYYNIHYKILYKEE